MLLLCYDGGKGRTYLKGVEMGVTTGILKHPDGDVHGGTEDLGAQQEAMAYVAGFLFEAGCLYESSPSSSSWSDG